MIILRNFIIGRRVDVETVEAEQLLLFWDLFKL